MRVCRYGAARTLISSVHLLKLPADTGDAITKQRALGKQYKALARPFNPQSGRSGFIALLVSRDFSAHLGETACRSWIRARRMSSRKNALAGCIQGAPYAMFDRVSGEW